MRLFLTGATGFVGRNMAVRAAQRGWTVLAPVRDAAKLGRLLHEDGVAEGVVEPLPADPASWPDPLPVDAAVHAAGALFERRLGDFLETNLRWTMAALARLPAHCPAIVLSSQSAGGPTPPQVAARNERTADEPASAYGESKLRMERAIRRDLSGRPVVILRPPMILGPRDRAALQLFHMARGLVRTKPGFREKWYSFIAVGDLLDAMDVAMPLATGLAGRVFYVAARRPVSDRALVAAVASSMGCRGVTVPLPELFVRAVALVVDATPALRERLPSLTRDRVREIWPRRWVVDPSVFERETGWVAKTSLAGAVDAARIDYASRGLL